MIATINPPQRSKVVVQFAPIFWRRQSSSGGGPTPSMAVSSPASVNINTVTTIHLTGTNTSWTSGTTFSVAGVSGAVASAPSVNVGAQTATFTLTTGASSGTVTISDSTDSATTTFSIVDPSASANRIGGKVGLAGVRNSVDVVANKTLTAADQGFVQNVKIDGVVITLPSTAKGLTFTIRNGGKAAFRTPVGSMYDGSVGYTIAPQVADGISGLSVTAATNKGLVSDRIHSRIGEEITLVGSGAAGTRAWNVAEAFGTYTRVP